MTRAVVVLIAILGSARSNPAPPQTLPQQPEIQLPPLIRPPAWDRSDQPRRVKRAAFD